MCYHSQRREELAKLGHETGLYEPIEERTDEPLASERTDDQEPREEHHPDRPTLDATPPEPVGFA